jgi:dCTP deaminase
MILGNEAIVKAFNSPTGWGFNNASVLEKKQVQPASVDLRLDSWFTCPVTKTVWNEREPFVLKPQGFILGRTLESLWLSQFLAAQVGTRSSAMREGIDVCMSAGWIDPGYNGKITLEITNHTDKPFILNPLVVNENGDLEYENQSYCQIVLMQVMGCTEPYRGKYGGPQQDESDMMSKGVEK